MMTRTLAGLLAVMAGLGAATAQAEFLIAIEDVTGRGFPPDLVNYTLPAGMAGGPLRLNGSDGQPRPFQVTGPGADGRHTLSFAATLPAGARQEYRLAAAVGAVPASRLRTEQDGDTLVLAHDGMAVRVPAPAARTFDKPVAASTLPAPILQFRSGKGGWIGAGRLLDARPVRAWRASLTAKGPVFAEYLYELDYAEGGTYRARLQVIDGVPLVKVREEYDAGAPEVHAAWELDLTAGWTPDMMEIASATSGTGFEKSLVAPLSGLGATPDPIRSEWIIIPDSAWYSPRTHFGVFAEADRAAASNAYPVAGFVPLHKGDWRRSNGIEIHTPDSKAVRLRLPMAVRHASWLREVTSETSPFSIHEHEQDLPVTYGRRVWALVLGHPDLTGLDPSVTRQLQGNVDRGPLAQVRSLYGIVGLDRYKDYVLDWPDSGVKYPRVFLQPGEVENFRRNLDRSPLAAELRRDWFLASGDEKVAAAALVRTRATLDWQMRYMLGTPTVGHHAMSGNAVKAAMAEDVLSWSGLPAADRAALRSRLALITYLFQEADVVSYANGSHTGPPNMGVAVSGPMGSFLALLPDHPMFARWRAHMAAYAEYRLGANMAPGGGWFEYGGAYHMHGFARISNGVTGLDAAGAPNLDVLNDYLKQDWDYYMNLLTPYDSRWQTRMVPGLANSPPSFSGHFMEASGALLKSDPAAAARLRWAWLANGTGNHDINPMLERPWVAPVEPELGSRLYPGVGVVFRAHQGPRETYMFLRAGYNWSHWSEDQGHFMLMSEGAVLMPFQSYQYGRSSNPEFDVCNLLRFGHPANRYPHSWPDANVLDHAFGPSVDYAWLSVGHPDWYIDPGTNPDFAPPANAPVGKGQLRPLAEGVEQKPGAFTWDRQVVFVKRQDDAGTDFFVFRDAANGAGKLAAWMNFNLLGTREDVAVKGDRLTVATEWPVTLNMQFPGAGPLAPDMDEQRFGISAWGGGSGLQAFRDGKPVSRNWVQGDGGAFTAPAAQNVFERHVLLRIAQPAGLDRTWLLWPGRDGGKAPEAQPMAPGVLKIVSADQTVFVFLDARHLEYADSEVSFAGQAGAVRLSGGKVTLSLLGGPGRVGYRGHVIESAAPFEKTLAVAQLRKGVHRGHAPGAVIVLAPRLSGHGEVAPGVARAEADGVIEYLAEAGAPVEFADGGVRIRADRAAVVVSPEGIRLAALSNGYAELAVGNVAVRGMGPFDLVFSDNAVRGVTAGSARTLAVTWPKGIVRPMYRMDGRRWYAGFGDNHTLVKNTQTPQFAIAFGVAEGRREVEIGEWTYPALPPAPERRAAEILPGLSR